MQIKSFDIESNDGRVETKPFLRAALDGSGCGSPPCKCSPPFFITLSDGKRGIMATLSKKEVEELLKGWVSKTGQAGIRRKA